MLRRRGAAVVATAILILGSAIGAGTADARRADHRPVVLLFHPGGLLGGGPDQMDVLAPLVVRAGMKPVSVDYALFAWPSAFEDAEAAAKLYGGRTVYAFGESAGGTLAGWLAARHLVTAAAANSSIVNLRAFLRAIKRNDHPHAPIFEAVSGGPRFVWRHSLQYQAGAPMRLFGNCRDPVAPCSIAIKYALHFPQVSWRRCGIGHIKARFRAMNRALAWFRSIPAPSTQSARSQLETPTG